MIDQHIQMISHMVDGMMTPDLGLINDGKITPELHDAFQIFLPVSSSFIAPEWSFCNHRTGHTFPINATSCALLGRCQSTNLAGRQETFVSFHRWLWGGNKRRMWGLLDTKGNSTNTGHCTCWELKKTWQPKNTGWYEPELGPHMLALIHANSHNRRIWQCGTEHCEHKPIYHHWWEGRGECRHRRYISKPRLGTRCGSNDAWGMDSHVNTPKAKQRKR